MPATDGGLLGERGSGRAVGGSWLPSPDGDEGGGPDDGGEGDGGEADGGGGFSDDGEGPSADWWTERTGLDFSKIWQEGDLKDFWSSGDDEGAGGGDLPEASGGSDPTEGDGTEGSGWFEGWGFGDWGWGGEGTTSIPDNMTNPEQSDYGWGSAAEALAYGAWDLFDRGFLQDRDGTSLSPIVEFNFDFTDVDVSSGRNDDDLASLGGGTPAKKMTYEECHAEYVDCVEYTWTKPCDVCFGYCDANGESDPRCK